MKKNEEPVKEVKTIKSVCHGFLSDELKYNDGKLIGSDWNYVEANSSKPKVRESDKKVDNTKKERKSNFHGHLSDELKYNGDNLIGSDWNYVDPKDPKYHHEKRINKVKNVSNDQN